MSISLVTTHSNPDAFISFLNEYENFFTFLATVAALVALFVSIKAINKGAKDSRHQIHIGKLEEICDILNTLVREYTIFYYAYNLLYNFSIQTHKERFEGRLDFEAKWKTAISEIDVNIYLDKVSRLYILTNLYLGEKEKKVLGIKYSKKEKDLKFSTIIFAEIMNNILSIIKHKNLKYNSFPDKLPNPDIMGILNNNISAEINKKIQFGSDAIGYKEMRTDFFYELHNWKLEDNP